MTDSDLIGIGLYTPGEAGALIGVRPSRLVRWLKGHQRQGKHYRRLWAPQVDLGDEHVYLGFHDLMEARVASAFIGAGLSAQKVRRAIEVAREILGEERPLSTNQFRTDGRSVFLQMSADDGDRLINLFKKQYEFKAIVEPSLRNVEFDAAGLPMRWWPLGKAGSIVIDPSRSFGRPIESTSSVPASVLAAAADAEGSLAAAARAWAVTPSAVRSALRFRDGFDMRKAA
ncbi:MAG: hypothetical protein RIM84_05770 [Alphaproteobacteria bacterium]